MSDQHHNPCFDSEQLNKGLGLSITKELFSAMLKIEQLQKENAELQVRVVRLEEREATLQSIILFLQNRTATFDFTHPNIILGETNE